LPSDTARPGGSALIRRLCWTATRRRPRRPVGLHLQPDLDPGRHGADADDITQAITASNQPAHCGRALTPIFTQRISPQSEVRPAGSEGCGRRTRHGDRVSPRL
jgi:hypothetical protein